MNNKSKDKRDGKIYMYTDCTREYESCFVELNIHTYIHTYVYIYTSICMYLKYMTMKHSKLRRTEGIQVF